MGFAPLVGGRCRPEAQFHNSPPPSSGWYLAARALPAAFDRHSHARSGRLTVLDGDLISSGLRTAEYDLRSVSDPYRDALRKDARVKEYQILRVLGQGGFGITYLAFDLNLDGPIALKEYFPKEYAVRSADGHVSAASAASAENFDWGRQRFLDEARAINRFRHPNVVRAHRFFQSGGSVYIVMDYIEGESLDTILEKRSKLSPAEWRPLLDRLLDGLEHVHQHDYLHRDIKPGNIMIRDNDGEPVFIDFGSARLDTGDRTHTQVLTPGYAPLEQLGSGQQEGPPTDLYALAVVSYRALLGELPPGAPDRAIEDTIARLEQQVTGAERSWLAALDRCLAVYPNDRPQSVTSLRNELQAKTVPTDNPEVEEYRRRFSRAKSGNGRILSARLPPPDDDWEIRRWVGRRSSRLNATVFAPSHRAVQVDAGDTPLFERRFDRQGEAFSWLFELENSGAINKAGTSRVVKRETGARTRSETQPYAPPPESHAEDPSVPLDRSILEEAMKLLDESDPSPNHSQHQTPASTPKTASAPPSAVPPTRPTGDTSGTDASGPSGTDGWMAVAGVLTMMSCGAIESDGEAWVSFRFLYSLGIWPLIFWKRWWRLAFPLDEGSGGCLFSVLLFVTFLTVAPFVQHC